MIKQIRILLFTVLALCGIYMSISCIRDYVSPFLYVEYTNFTGSNPDESHVLFTDGCKVPRFDPFDSTVIKYLKNVSGNVPCKGKKYLILKDNKVFLDNMKVTKDFGNNTFTCTYMAIHRNPKNETRKADDKIEYGNEKLLKFNETLLDEFIRVFCLVDGNLVHEDFLASTPIKPPVEKRRQENISSNCTEKQFPLNVIVVGIDSISKLNFERHFRLTSEYLRQNISALEFHGYMKVADNTFPNLTPLLTGHFVEHYFKTSNSQRYFDDLDFIWKNYSSIGYRTFLAEDAPEMATYNYLKNGFQYPPTDYYFRPFALAIEDSPWRKNSKVDCFQSTPEIKVLFDYLRSFLETMGNRPYFAFTWAARLTHGSLNRAGYADKPTYELLRDIHDMGLLNRSMLIFMSDHGIRFGDIRKTYIGKIEERMPFLFITLPSWFLESHPDYKTNIISNQRKLVTPFDLHETLVDLYQIMSGDYSYIRTPYGISLFKEIPSNRDCKSSFILPHWCVCHKYKKLHTSNKMVVAAAKSLIAELNNITKPYRKLCNELELGVILDSRVTDPEANFLYYHRLRREGEENSIIWGRKVDSYEILLITVKTLPGEAEFESTIRNANGLFKIFDISRINKYGSQGDCINNFNIRKYCYCKTFQFSTSSVSVHVN